MESFISNGFLAVLHFLQLMWTYFIHIPTLIDTTVETAEVKHNVSELTVYATCWFTFGLVGSTLYYLGIQMPSIPSFTKEWVMSAFRDSEQRRNLIVFFLFWPVGIPVGLITLWQCLKEMKTIRDVRNSIRSELMREIVDESDERFFIDRARKYR